MLITALSRYIIGIVITGAVLFIPAGTLSYWNAWLFLGTVFIPMGLALVYLIKRDPELLEKRMRTREKETRQKAVTILSLVFFPLTFIIPGLDFRFGWSHLPLWLTLLAAVIMMMGYGLFILVMKENTYASRVIEVQQGQKIIDTGVYALVRHPMYLSALLIFMFAPLVLGSYWALLPALGFPVIFILRILNEEEVLKRDLPQYQAYMAKVKYRLIPYIW